MWINKSRSFGEEVMETGNIEKNIKLLDCTLRDGGYVNDWKFGHNNAISMLERLVTSGVDIIEIGFLDQRRPFDIERSIMPTTECVEKIYGNVDKKDAMIVGMIDYGTCGIENLQPCSESYLDGIRVIFKKHIMHEAIAFCKQVKDLGYKVFTQAVSITSYSDEELLELLELVNNLEPYAVSMVDTYGLLQKGNLMHYFSLMDKHLKSEIGLGYHSHNNFQLAYANCMEVLKYQTTRTIVVDGTLYGMGKSAGNAPIELLGMHLNEVYGKQYDVNQMLEAIDGNVMKIYKETPWGYNMFFYVAASNHCHPNYVKFLMDKHTLSIKSVNEILDCIEPEKKLLYDQAHIEELYLNYQASECDDAQDRVTLKGIISQKSVLVLGPGTTIKTKANEIRKFYEEKHPIVIAINHLPDVCPVDFVFLSNPRRYIRLINSLKEHEGNGVKVIATSNVTNVEDAFEYTVNNEKLLDKGALVIDYSFVMLLRLLNDLNPSEVYCAGTDGYTTTGSNYADEDMEYWFTSRKADVLNQYVRDTLHSMEKSLKVTFLTPSYYESDL